MDSADKHDVREIIGRYISEKECPTCDAETTMIKVEVWPNAEGLYIPSRWRCLNCLEMFTETMKPVG